MNQVMRGAPMFQESRAPILLFMLSLAGLVYSIAFYTLVINGLVKPSIFIPVISLLFSLIATLYMSISFQRLHALDALRTGTVMREEAADARTDLEASKAAAAEEST